MVLLYRFPDWSVSFLRQFSFCSFITSALSVISVKWEQFAKQFLPSLDNNFCAVCCFFLLISFRFTCGPAMLCTMQNNYVQLHQHIIIGMAFFSAAQLTKRRKKSILRSGLRTINILYTFFLSWNANFPWSARAILLLLLNISTWSMEVLFGFINFSGRKLVTNFRYLYA